MPLGVPLVVEDRLSEGGHVRVKDSGLFSARPIERPVTQDDVFWQFRPLGGDAAGHILTVNVGAVAATRHSQLPARCEPSLPRVRVDRVSAGALQREGHPARSDRHQSLTSRKGGRIAPSVQSNGTSNRLPVDEL